MNDTIPPRLFRVEQPTERPITWGDGVVLTGVGVLIYLGVRLAFAAPAVVKGPEMSLVLSLLEHLVETPGNRHDIYWLADDLGVDSDQLLRLTETAELLGFATIGQGDITLTPLGETFAEASILARKEIFATRIRRLPLFKWLTTMLRSANRQQLEWDVVQTALELEFPPEEAERQLETAVNWGRYAELIAYDDDNGVLYLELGGA